MEEILKSIDNVAEKIFSFYQNSAWSSFNRTGLGIVGVILIPILWYSVLTSDEQLSPEGFFVFILMSASAVINILPLIIGLYLFLRKSTNETKSEQDINFLPSIKKKVANDEPLTEHESQFYLADIQRRKNKGERLIGAEYCADTLRNEDNFEKYLFKSTDEEFVYGIGQFKNSLNKDEFDQICNILFAKVPTRMTRLFLQK